MNGQSFIGGALKRIAGAGRKAPPLNLPADDAAAIQYLYVPGTRDSGHPDEAHRSVHAVPIAKKTARVICYASDHWNWREAVVRPSSVITCQGIWPGARTTPAGQVTGVGLGVRERGL
jgi:hypothetical protein